MGCKGNSKGRGRGCGMGNGRGMGCGHGMGNGFGMGANRAVAATRGLGSGWNMGPSFAMGSTIGMTSQAVPPLVTQGHQHDQQVFHSLLAHHTELNRVVENLPNGIRAVTTSENPQLAALIVEHAHVMHHRLQQGAGLRFWDEAFVEIFAQADKVHMQIINLPNGVEVIETSEDPNVVKLIQAHGQVIVSFIKEGFDAARRASPVPEDYIRRLSHS